MPEQIRLRNLDGTLERIALVDPTVRPDEIHLLDHAPTSFVLRSQRSPDGTIFAQIPMKVRVFDRARIALDHGDLEYREITDGELVERLKERQRVVEEKHAAMLREAAEAASAQPKTEAQEFGIPDGHPGIHAYLDNRAVVGDDGWSWVQRIDDTIETLEEKIRDLEEKLEGGEA